MAMIHVCDYNGYPISVNSETGVFASEPLFLEKPSMASLKTAMRDAIKERGLFKPFLVVEKYDSPGTVKKVISKDLRGYRLESGSYITANDFARTKVVPDSYLADIAAKLTEIKEARKVAGLANQKVHDLEEQLNADYPTIKEWAK